jgi:hypothetical protein
MFYRLPRWLMIAGLLLLIVAVWRSEALPPPAELNPALLAEPVQTLVKQPPFETVTGGVTYTVQPLYQYELTGLVVSKHNADSWWDHLHREWNDSLNVTDLCVVWGKNVESGLYAEMSFWSGQFTCNLEAKSQEAYQSFDYTAISNNHLLTDKPAIAKVMRSVRVGDQIRFRGHLAEYSHNSGFPFKRGTSITRTDMGNGACETVFVDSFDVLKRGGHPWRMLVWVAGAMLLLGLIGWMALPARFHD